MSDLKTIILAAGRGLRMKSDIPKVLHPVCGLPMIQYVINVARTSGSLKIYVVLGHQFEEVKKALDSDLVTIRQKKLLGTADAVKSALARFRNDHGQTVVLCGDTPLLTKKTISTLIKKHKSAKAVCTVLTAIVKDPQGYGRIIRDDQGRLVAIREDNDTTPLEKQIDEINVGVYCFQTDILFQAIKSIRINQKKKEFYLTDIIELFAGKGRKVESLQTEQPMEGLGINSREDLATVGDLMRNEILKKWMAQGVTIEDPLTTYIAADVSIGKDTVIRPMTVIESNVRIGRHCKIGPFCRLRPGTKIADHVEVGNFTEVSRSQIGKNSLMKHFSFLGDAIVGSKVNIGAGAVTANYDGKNKHQTKIGDRAFIGSDSILVAPVKIGKKSMTGAGSVVTKGSIVPDGKIAAGVPAKILRRRNA